MSLIVSISPQIEAKLRERAASEGQDPVAYASHLLEQAVRQAYLRDVLAPLREEFAASGTTDDELLQQISEARDAWRKQA